MGLDINIATDNYKEVYTTEYYTNETDFRKKMNLSRTFCNFMCRRHMISKEAELDQIGRLVNVDIGPIYQMDNYCDEESINEQLEFIESEIDKEKYLLKAKDINEKIKGNINIISDTIDSLFSGISKYTNLEKLITDHGYDTLGNDFYFSEFKGTGDNFKNDLENFKRFLAYAKSKNAKTVYFIYG